MKYVALLLALVAGLSVALVPAQAKKPVRTTTTTTTISTPSTTTTTTPTTTTVAATPTFHLHVDTSGSPFLFASTDPVSGDVSLGTTGGLKPFAWFAASCSYKSPAGFSSAVQIGPVQAQDVGQITFQVTEGELTQSTPPPPAGSSLTCWIYEWGGLFNTAPEYLMDGANGRATFSSTYSYS